MKEEVFRKHEKDINKLEQYYFQKMGIMNAHFKLEDIRGGYLEALRFLDKYFKSYSEYYDVEDKK
jgi:hypothetical protein